MSNKMLIDASHPEETRVAVVRGNRIEEFDFESQEKKQLRGNIYLAKVTRVEPSLQAAFVDYGGNRHGFLAFSEIHPDYYQIPMADRQALLEAEAAEERARRDEEEQDATEEDTGENGSVNEASDEKEEAPKKKPARKRRSRKAKAADETEGSEEAAEDQNAGDEKPAEETASDDAVETAAQDEPEAEKPAPKRRTTRRRTSTKKAAKEDEVPKEETPTDSDNDDGDADEDENPTTMAAIVEVDSISEDLPEAGSEEDGSDGEENNTSESTVEAEAEEKPKRRTSRRRTSRKKEAEPDQQEETTAEAAEETAAQSEEATSSDSESDDASEEQEKPKKRASRRRSSRSKKKAEEADAKDASADSDGNGDDDANGNNGNDVEQVGQEDALEEVPSPRRQRRYYKIQEVIKRRQILLVQVVKEERGNKGAALTTYLSLAGRYSVLMPNTARGGGISRKITNTADRKRLKGIASKLDVPEGMGVILRTAGASRTDAEINRDFEYLMRLWEQVRNLTLSSSAPCLVYEEGSLIKRSIRDLYDKDTGDILVTGDQGYQEAKDFMSMLMPEHVNKVKHYTNKQALFAKFGVEAHLERMMTPQVTLKSGGYLVINQTEALVAVDVNSGRSTREHSIEDTALQTNLEAAEEVARQLRLRDLAGLIVIDFIDMEEKRNNRAVEKKLKDCLKNDRARIQVGRISHFGLLEMSRQRMRSSVLESTMEVCEHCGGLGYIRSDSAIALHVFRAIEEHVSRHNKFDAVVKTTRAIAFHILNHKRAALLELEKLYGLRVIIQGEANIQGQEFNIEKGEPAQGDVASAAVGFQNEAAFEAMTSDGEEEKEASSGKKRGRRRNAKSTDAEAEAEGEANAAASDDEADDDAPRKKRRRGKRGGRKRGKAQDGEETASDEHDAAPASNASDEASEKPSEPEETKEPAEAESTESTPDGEEQEQKPVRKNRVTQKAPIQEKPKTEAVSEETAEEPRPEPPRPQRRRTSRRTEDESDAAPSSAPVEEVLASSSQPEPAVSEPAAEKKPGKKGWWSRGGGFF